MTDPNKPCQGCPDRYPACQDKDHCQKPAYLAWREKKRLEFEGRRKSRMWVTAVIESGRRRQHEKKEGRRRC